LLETAAADSAETAVRQRRQLNTPVAVETDLEGNLYIGDYFNHRIRKVTPFGLIRTIAGTGLPSGSPGDGGPATSATVSFPRDVFADGDGNIYVPGFRKITPTGLINTVVRSRPAAGFEGDGGPATAALLDHPYGVALDRNGNLYISDTFNRRIRKVTLDRVITAQ
jgi:hypothetical protein